MSETNRDGPYLRCEAGGIEIRVWLPELTADYLDEEPTDEMIEKADALVKSHLRHDATFAYGKNGEDKIEVNVWMQPEWEING